MSFKGIVYDFSVDYNAIDKSEILNIHKYLMVNSKSEGNGGKVKGNSETVKAINLAFFSIQKYLISDICAKFGIPKSSQSSYVGQNSDGRIFNFWISGQFLIQENCHNSRTSNDIDMKLGAVTKLGKRNRSTSKKFDDDVMSANCDAIVIFTIFDQFEAIWKPDSLRMVCKTHIFINSNLLSCKN